MAAYEVLRSLARDLVKVLAAKKAAEELKTSPEDQGLSKVVASIDAVIDKTWIGTMH